MDRQRAQTLLSRFVSDNEEFACHSAACQPPPGGTGGSLPGTSVAEQHGFKQPYMKKELEDKEAERAAREKTLFPTTGQVSYREAAQIKSHGAARVGQAIRDDHIHGAIVARYLDTPFVLTPKLFTTPNANSHPEMNDELARLYGSTHLEGKTIGEQLIGDRLYGMLHPDSFLSGYPIQLNTGKMTAAEAQKLDRSAEGLSSQQLQTAMRDDPASGIKGAIAAMPTTVAGAIANMRKHGAEAYIPRAEDELASRIMGRWAGGSTSESPSLALMHIVAKEKGYDFTVSTVKNAGHSETGVDARTEVYERGPVYEALAYGIHKSSVDYFAERGYKPDDIIRVYRGVDVGDWQQMVTSYGRREPGQPAHSTALTSTRVDSVTAQMHPLSSWTTQKEMSPNFGTAVFRQDIKVSDIFATAAVGFGAANESEVVAYGDPTSALVTMPGKIFHSQAFSVEHPIEFYNMNHDALGRFASAPGGVGAGSLKQFDVQRNMSPGYVKSLGATKAGQAIRDSPKHNKAVQEFLNQPWVEPPLHGNDKVDRLTNLFGVSFQPKTIGEALVARRLRFMYNNRDSEIYPLDGGVPEYRTVLPSVFRRAMEGDTQLPTPKYDSGKNLVKVPGTDAWVSSPKPSQWFDTEHPVSEIIANLRRNGMERFIPRAEDELVSAMQQSWQGSATNNSASLALMSRISALRSGGALTPGRIAQQSSGGSDWLGGILNDGGRVQNSTVADANNELATRGPVYDALAYGIHRASVDYLASQGLHPNDTIRLYRGMDLSVDHPVAKEVAAWGTVMPGASQKDLIHWHHLWDKSPGGAPPTPAQFKPTSVEIDQNPLSSWTTDLTTARLEFGNHVFRHDFKVSEIFATSATGFGSQSESEFVLYGGERIGVWAAQSELPPGPIQGQGGGQPDEAFSVISPLEFACHSAACRPPNSGGTGGSLPSGASQFPQVVFDRSLPRAVICDLDGTAALMGDRSPFEHGKYHLDTPNEAVRLILTSVNDRVVYASGRKEGARAETVTWLKKHGFPDGPIFFRAESDYRKDDIVKYEILRDTIAKQFNPVLVLDDRKMVVAMWRSQGLPTFQVAPGDFSMASEVEEFYNMNHSKIDGRFTSGEGGGLAQSDKAAMSKQIETKMALNKTAALAAKINKKIAAEKAAAKPGTTNKLLEQIKAKHAEKKAAEQKVKYPNKTQAQWDAEAKATKDAQHNLDVRRDSVFSAEQIKSIGASAAGEVIRNNPEHAAAFKEYLDRPWKATPKNKRWTRDAEGNKVDAAGNGPMGMLDDRPQTVSAKTNSERLIAYRLDTMVGFDHHHVMPLDHGKFGAGKEAATYFGDDRPKSPGSNGVTGQDIQNAMTSSGTWRTSTERPTVKKAIENLRKHGYGDFVPKAEDELISRMQDSWHVDSSGNATSVALMRTIGGKRGLGPPKDFTVPKYSGKGPPPPLVWQGQSLPGAWNPAGTVLKGSEKMFEAAAWGIHTASQNWLATQGLKPDDTIRIYRSVRVFAPDHRSPITEGSTGKEGKVVEVKATMYALSSWTTDLDTTPTFGDLVFRQDIKVRDIFATAGTGFGAAGEFEIVAYGGVDEPMLALDRAPQWVGRVRSDRLDFPEGFSIEELTRILRTDVGYSAAHMRVEAAKGKASAHKCSKCGAQAYHWSYNHKDPKGRRGLNHKVLRPYSVDPKYYDAFCTSCNKKRDLKHIAGSASTFAALEFYNMNHSKVDGRFTSGEGGGLAVGDKAAFSKLIKTKMAANKVAAKVALKAGPPEHAIGQVNVGVTASMLRRAVDGVMRRRMDVDIANEFGVVHSAVWRSQRKMKISADDQLLVDVHNGDQKAIAKMARRLEKLAEGVASTDQKHIADIEAAAASLDSNPMMRSAIARFGKVQIAVVRDLDGASARWMSNYIAVSEFASGKITAPLKIGGLFVDESASGTLRHEYGHFVQSMLTTAEDSAWHTAHQAWGKGGIMPEGVEKLAFGSGHGSDGAGVSLYARTNFQEAFAETFAMVTHPDFKLSDVPAAGRAPTEAMLKILGRPE